MSSARAAAMSGDKQRQEIDPNMTVQKLCDSHLMSVKHLANLLQASDKYLKVKYRSSRDTRTMCVNAYFEQKIGREKVKIKVSTYHDVKEVKRDLAEKQSIPEWKFLVMGTKLKEESWDKDEGYRLRYWMMYEVQPYGYYTFSEPRESNWSKPFKPCGDFEYQHIEEEKKDYGNLYIRKRGQCIFQVNYHTYNDGEAHKAGIKNLMPVPVKGNVPFKQEEYFPPQQELMEMLQNDIEDHEPMEYPIFIKWLKTVYGKKNDDRPRCELKRLDCFVLT